MIDANSTSFDWAFRVEDERQAQLLSDPVSKAFFKPFLAQERSVKQAAGELGCQLNTLLYRVKLFLEAGLLEITRKQKRKGRPIKLYRSVHDAYFIPFDLTPYATLEERMRVQLEPIANMLIQSYGEVLRGSERHGRYLFRTAEGDVASTDLPPQKDTRGLPVFLYDRTLRLKQDDAEALQAELGSLFKRYSNLNAEAEPHYMLMLSFVPLAD